MRNINSNFYPPLFFQVHFLMALSANYAHIRGHDKFSELQDLHDLTSETLTLTERMTYK